MMNRRKNDFGEKSKSKHQLKKERKLARKNKKSAKTKKRCPGKSKDDDHYGWNKFQPNLEISISPSPALDDQSNKNVEKNAVEIRDVNESGYSSGKASSPVQSGSDNAIHNENNNEILAEALSEINALPANNLMDGMRRILSVFIIVPCILMRWIHCHLLEIFRLWTRCPRWISGS